MNLTQSAVSKLNCDMPSITIDLTDLKAVLEAISPAYKGIRVMNDSMSDVDIVQSGILCLQSWNWNGVTIDDAINIFKTCYKSEFDADDLAQELRQHFRDQLVLKSDIDILNAALDIYLENWRKNIDFIKLGELLGQESNSEKTSRLRNLQSECSDIFSSSGGAALEKYLIESNEDPNEMAEILGLPHLHISGIGCAAFDEFMENAQHKGSRTLYDLLRWVTTPDGPPQQYRRNTYLDLAYKLAEGNISLSNQLMKWIKYHFGDPRLETSVGWSEIDEDIRIKISKLFSHSDLHLFFDALDETVSAKDQKMWQRRKQFWEEIFENGHIKSVWLALHSTHKDRLTERGSNSHLSHGMHISKSSGQVSLIIFEFEYHLAIEGSANCPVYIFEKDWPECPKLFAKTYDRSKYADIVGVETFKHSGRKWMEEIKKILIPHEDSLNDQSTNNIRRYFNALQF